jgi:SAM-dependent methyltransferase
MFTETAAFYDALYAARGKDYVREADAVVAHLRRVRPDAASLIDVGCGTGAHLARFQKHDLACRGIDKDVKMVALARARCPEIEIEAGDMLDFVFPERFDAVTCLFGTVAYARTPDRLATAVANMSRHLSERGGVLFVEPFIDPDAFQVGNLHSIFVDEPDLKIARMNVSKRVGPIAIIDFHYLIATKRSGVERRFERHELGLFSENDYRKAFRAAGLSFEALVEPAFERGLYLGLK